MKIVVIYGAEHKGSTYHIAQLFLERLKAETTSLTEFFLPKDMPYFCIGCCSCFKNGEGNCPHINVIDPIKKAMEEADLLIFASPVYVYHTTGQMKTLLDHFGFQWMAHRPNKSMFSKISLVISTAAGAGMKSTNKDIIDSLDFWGIGKVFSYGKGVAAVNWQGVNDKIKASINKDVARISKKIIKSDNKVTPRFKVKLLFHIMRFMQIKFKFNQIDYDYWQNQGWLGRIRPWN